MSNKIEQKQLEAEAREVASRAGLRVVKSRRSVPTLGDVGGFMLVDDAGNHVVAGWNFTFEVEDIIAYCGKE